MVGISYFSSRSDPLGPLSASEMAGLIGNAAHIAEYAGLAVLLHRAWAGDALAWPRPSAGEHFPPAERQAFAFSLVAGLLFALLDEFHQSFVPGREASLSDVALDASGLGMALTGVWLGIKKWGTRNVERITNQRTNESAGLRVNGARNPQARKDAGEEIRNSQSEVRIHVGFRKGANCEPDTVRTSDYHEP
jgi:hypothetical protein